MSSLNLVCLIGNLGKDPERRDGPWGPIVSFSLATSDYWKDKATGELKEKTEWHKIVIFNERFCGTSERFLRKGSKVYIQGQLQTRKYTNKENIEVTVVEVILSKFRGELIPLDSKGEAHTLDSISEFVAKPPMPDTKLLKFEDINDDIPF